MKRYYKIIIAVALVIALSTICITGINAATIFVQDGFYYSRASSTTADLYGRENTDADLVVPKAFSEYYVISIVDSAFKEDEDIVTLDFSKATLLERIGFYSFKNCTNLSGAVILGGRINSLGMSAFEGCSSLEEIFMKNSFIEVIPAQCFYNCTSLSSVTLPNRLRTIGKFAFANCSISEITIPAGVTSIDATAFSGNDGMVINCYTDSYAQQFAIDNGYDYVLIDAPAPTEPATDATEPESTATEPETAATEPASEESTSAALSNILGDTDNSGYIDIVDATFVQRYATNIEVPLSHYVLLQGDVDRSGDLEITDAAFIMRHIIRMKTPYAIGEAIPA